MGRHEYEEAVRLMSERTAMITVKLTSIELALLTSLAADQLFRREFIDPKMPGYKSNSAETNLGKALVARLRTMAVPAWAGRILPRLPA
jgi:hypothetical protein